MKGFSMMAELAMIIAIGFMILVFFYTRIYAPSIAARNQTQADFLARNLALAANAMASLDETDGGSVVTGLGLTWDVSVEKEGRATYIRVASGDMSSRAPVYTDMAVKKVTGERINISKSPGAGIMLEVAA